MAKTILSLKNITKYYEQYLAISDVGLEIEKGKIFGLLGPNGAGKTTLLRIINRIIKPTKGKIYYKNEIMTEQDLSYFGYMPEERGVYKNMGVEEQAIYFAMLRGLDKSEAKKLTNEWFEKLDMNSWKNKKANELSKGMGQKLQFVITVLHKPRLLILDEPFSGFDPVNAMIIRDEIINLKKQGTTIILSTHRMDSVEELCDDMAIIYKSKNALSGNVEKIKQQYSKEFYRVELKTEQMDLIEKQNKTIKTINYKGNGKVEFSLKTDSPNKSLIKLMEYGDIISFKEELPSINDIFIEIVKDEKYIINNTERVSNKS